MKLEHLIQAYNLKGIPAKIKEEVNDKNEFAGVIQYSNDIYSSYLLDEENIVIALNIFCNCLTSDKKLKKQLEHSINTIKIFQKTIELIGNTKQEEANEILKNLNIFSGKIETKAVKFLNYIYKIDLANGILILSIVEKNEEIPPLKSEVKKILKGSGGGAFLKPISKTFHVKRG